MAADLGEEICEWRQRPLGPQLVPREYFVVSPVRLGEVLLRSFSFYFLRQIRVSNSSTVETARWSHYVTVVNLVLKALL